MNIDTIITELESVLHKFEKELNRNYDCGDPCIMEQGQIKGAQECIKAIKQLKDQTSTEQVPSQYITQGIKL